MLNQLLYIMLKQSLTKQALGPCITIYKQCEEGRTSSAVQAILQKQKAENPVLHIDD